MPLSNKIVETRYSQMSVCLCAHSNHDEIVNFTGVERTNTEINVPLSDNANYYMIKSNKVEKIPNDR